MTAVGIKPDFMKKQNTRNCYLLVILKHVFVKAAIPFFEK